MARFLEAVATAAVMVVLVTLYSTISSPSMVGSSVASTATMGTPAPSIILARMMVRAAIDIRETAVEPSPQRLDRDLMEHIARVLSPPTVSGWWLRRW